MSSRRKPSAVPFALAGLAVFLMAGPRFLPQAARTTAALAFVPMRATALGASHLLGRVTPSAPAVELEKQLDYYRAKAQEYVDKYSAAQERLREVSGVREVFPDPRIRLVPASVIVNADSCAWRKSIVVARGSSSGVARGQLVLWEKHLVGRVAEVGPWSARVQLIGDPAFKVGGVAVPRQQDGASSLASRDTGVFEGCGEKGGVLKWVSGETTAEDGAIVVTTPDPANGIPQGLILGRITGVQRGRGPYPRVELVPFVNPRALESVVVVVGVE